MFLTFFCARGPYHNDVGNFLECSFTDKVSFQKHSSNNEKCSSHSVFLAADDRVPFVHPHPLWGRGFERDLKDKVNPDGLHPLWDGFHRQVWPDNVTFDLLFIVLGGLLLSRICPGVKVRKLCTSWWLKWAPSPQIGNLTSTSNSYRCQSSEDKMFKRLKCSEHVAWVANHLSALCPRGSDEEDCSPAATQWKADLHRTGQLSSKLQFNFTQYWSTRSLGAPPGPNF